MFGFVARLRKVEVVKHRVVFVVRGKDNLHIEFTPSLLCDSERWVFEGYTFEEEVN